jgi:hypothetical protein
MTLGGTVVSLAHQLAMIGTVGDGGQAPVHVKLCNALDLS